MNEKLQEMDGVLNMKAKTEMKQSFNSAIVKIAANEETALEAIQ